MISFLKDALWKIKTALASYFSRLKARKTSKTSGENMKNSGADIDKQLVLRVQKKKFPSVRQIQNLPFVLTDKEKRTISFLFAIIVICVIFLGYRFYIANSVIAPRKGGEYTEGLIGAPRFINPLLAHTNDVDLDLVHLIFSGLLTYDTSLNLVNDLAQDYAISQDQKTYTFILRENALWHDGRALTADDVVFTYESIQDSDFKSPLRLSLRGVKVEKKNNREIVFTLNQPYPQFLQVLTTGILPQHIWSKIPAVNANLTEFNLRPIGSGPWKFKSRSRDSNGNIKSYILVPHQNYYGHKPYIKKLTFKFYPDFDVAIDALNNRVVEGISYISRDKKNKIKNPSAQFYSFYLPQYTALFFNQKNNELLKDRTLRLALVISIDKTKIFTDAVKLQGEIIHGPLLPGAAGYDPNVFPEKFNPARAEEILEKNGWKKITSEERQSILKSSVASQAEAGETGATSTKAVTATPDTKTKEPKGEQQVYRKKGDKILKVKLTTVNISEYETVAELVAKFWRAIGIEVEIEIIPAQNLTRDIIKPRNYEIFLYGENYGSDPDPYPFWHSSQNQDPGLNLAIFFNRNIDTILEEAKQAKSAEEKTKKYSEFQKTLMEEIPAIFLYSPTYTYTVHEKVHLPKIERIISPHDRLIGSEEWHIKTRRKFEKQMRNEE